MPSALIIPGVQVTTQFEPAPVLPSATGILGVVGVADRGPAVPTPVSSFGEFIDLFGPASRYTMPEVRTALGSGVREVVVSRIAAGRGKKAFRVLLDSEGEEVLRLEARAEGKWGNDIGVQVESVKTLGGGGVKYVNLTITLAGQTVETINNLVLDVNSADYLFDKINRLSRLIVATDPKFDKDLPPAVDAEALADADEKAAAAELDVAAGKITVTAKNTGPAGNAVVIRVTRNAANDAVDIDVLAEGREPQKHAGLKTPADFNAINNPTVKFDATADAALPATQQKSLRGGRAKGPALQLPKGDPDPLVEFVAAPGVKDPIKITIVPQPADPNNPGTFIRLTVAAGENPPEEFSDLTMDPDDPGYLPRVLESSSLIRAHDLFVRSGATSLPKGSPAALKLGGGTSPILDDYQEALEKLEAAEEVDLVIASVNNQLDDAGIRAAHRAVVTHCTKMADLARNRIGIGSVTPKESNQPPAMLDHADDVRSDYFILCAPAGTEAAVAGLLGRQSYFDSPTFKTVVGLDVAAGTYSDAQLTTLLTGNVLTVNRKRGRGTIVVKGLLTSGRQVNVQRIANKAVRDVKAIADVYIGLLNNEGTRNALRQQVFALLLQMTRDGALVPSTDGQDPAFAVDVYSTQADFGNGIVRIDLAMRPVRAIDYVYATILVKN